MVIRPEVEAEILRLHHVEKWPPGTIAAHLHVHHDVVTRVIECGGAPPARPQRTSRIDAYVPFIVDTLRRYPDLLAYDRALSGAGTPARRSLIADDTGAAVGPYQPESVHGRVGDQVLVVEASAEQIDAVRHVVLERAAPARVDRDRLDVVD